MPKLAPVVAVLNMKGGVGKTTVAANLFVTIFEQMEMHSLVVDFDPQFNLTQTFMDEEKYEELVASNKTILSALEAVPSRSLFDIRATDAPPPSAESIAHDAFFLKQSPETKFHLIPGNFDLVKYNMLEGADNQLATVRNRFRTFIDTARSKYDVVAIDCNPSSSFLTGCAIHVATHILVPVRPDRYSVLGLDLLRRFIRRFPITPKPKVIVLLNGVRRTAAATDVENQLRTSKIYSKITLTNRIHYSDILVPKQSDTTLAIDKKVAHSNRLRSDMTAVAAELCETLGI